MVCKNTEEKLHELLDGQLGAEEREGLRAHLKTCPACNAYFRHLQLMEKSLEHLPYRTPGPDFNQKVLAALGHAPKKVFPALWQRWVAGLTLSAVSAWTAGILFFISTYWKSLESVSFLANALFPSGLRLSLEIAALKGLSGFLHFSQAAQGMLSLLLLEIHLSHSALQWVLSWFLAAALILALSSGPHPLSKRRAP